MIDDTAKVIAKEQIDAPIGHASPKIARKWTNVQIPYANFAGRHDALDAMAATFVMARREQFRAAMAGPMRRWAVNWSAANTEVTWQERPDDVHMPETKKALDGKVARIEEAVTGFQPVFEAEGTKGELSRRTAKVIGEYVYRKMEIAEWKRYVQPLAKDGELCNVMAMKVMWDKRVEDIVEREDETTYDDDGMPRHSVTRRIRRAVIYDGPVLKQIDPFWFIYDLEADSPQECAYIGDESTPFLHDLERMAEQGLYSKEAVARVRAQASSHTGRSSDDTSRAEWPDQLRRSRSIATDSSFTRDVRSENGAIRVRQVEMWAWFDFGDGYEGIVDPRGKQLKGLHRVVITIANGIVIRLQQNFYDRKFVPYAFEMVNRTGHELVAPAPFDAVVQMNANYDRLASNHMRWMDLSAAPLIVASGDDNDLPDNILNVEAGRVFRHTGTWDWLKVPDITGAMGYQHSFFRREMEETSGNLRVFESPQGTATETERKVQEQQRMVRNSIRANGNLWRQVAHLIKGLEGQFSTGPQRFKVSGKSAALLGEWAEITPDMLHEDVDFRFLGLTDMHTFGNRLQGMAQWMNRWGPMLPQMPQINMNSLCRMDFELSVGYSNANEIFPESSASWELWTQAEENEMLLAGQHVPIHRGDDDAQHIEELVPLLQQLIRRKAPKYVVQNVFRHLQAHMQAGERKKAEQQAQMQEQQLNANLMNPMGGQPGVDRPPVDGGLQAPASQRANVTPGPDQARTVARTGREGAGTSQSQVMAR